MQNVIEHFATNNINISPGGLWEIDADTNKKKPINPNRSKGASWEQYPEDNMGRHFLTEGIIVVDLDGAECIVNEDNSFTIPALDLTLPSTLATTTSAAHKRHLYYKTNTTNIGNRMIGVAPQIDILTYGFVFDPHMYSEHSSCNLLPIEQAPQDLIDIAVLFTEELDTPTAQAKLGIASNITQYNIIQAFLDDELTSNKSWNSFFRLVFPREYISKGKKKITFEDFDLSYDLINKIAVKLTTTAELSTFDHTVPALHKIVKELGGDPNSSKTKQFLHRQIMPSLPQHEATMPYTILDDALTIPEHIKKQDTPTPVFKVMWEGKIKFVQIDRFTLEPIEHNGTYFFDEKAARSINPERAITSEDGKVVGWDDAVPIVYITDSPYKPSLYVDEESNRNVINLYKRTRYLKEAIPHEDIADTNFIMQLLASSIHPDYLDLVLQYHAQVVFGANAPVMVLWIASLKSDKGGTGKSIITIDLLSRILGTAGTVIGEDDMAGSWGDVLIGARILSLEDLPNLGTRQFDRLYASIKQSTSSAQKRLNMKGQSFRTERLNVAINGSSNERLALHASDRRFLCLEPAHLRGHTEPLDEDTSLEVEEFRRSVDYSPELQAYTDYLLYLYNKPLSKQMKKWLFISPPETPYRTKWIASAQTNTANIITLLNTPMALHDTIRIDSMSVDDVLELYELLLQTYNVKTGKTAVSWKWFAQLLPYIQSNPEHTEFSKAQVSKMLQIDFVTNVGSVYSDNWARKWPASGHVFKLEEESYKEYQQLVLALKEEYHA